MKVLVLVFALAMAFSQPTQDEELFSRANDQFTAKMFSEVAKNNPGNSIVLSGLSVMTPLAQLALASRGPSHDELLKTIGLPNDEAVKKVFPQITNNLKSIKGVELKMANRIYIRDGSELNDDFAVVTKNVFDSEVKKVDFSKSVETANEINTWVEDQTNHRIKDLVDSSSLDDTTSAVLVNALYFKGTWEDQFNKQLTRDRDFHISKDQTKKIPIMFRNGNYKYYESKELDAKILEIPYKGSESSMVVVLPNEIDGLHKLEEKLKDSTSLTSALENMYTFEVDVSLPKFKIETTTNLKDVLSGMGVTKLFSAATARLENLLKHANNLYISEAIQKAFIEVNEEGAEAAAANAFFVGYSAAFNPNMKTFVADHPFFYCLKNQQNILFSGHFTS